MLLIRMKAAETSASIATADWTPLTVVSRSSTTAEIDTFMNDVSITNTNIAAAAPSPSRRPPAAARPAPVLRPPSGAGHAPRPPAPTRRGTTGGRGGRGLGE